MELSTWILMASSLGFSLSEFWRGCYHTKCSQNINCDYRPEDLDVSLCSHLFFGIAYLSNNELKPSERDDESSPSRKGMYERIADLKVLKPDLKVLLGVGKNGFKDNAFKKMITSKESRKHFIKTSIKFLRDRNFDGLHLPLNQYKCLCQGYRDLAKELREAFNEEASLSSLSKLLLTTSVPAIEKKYRFNNISKYFDMINLASYDLYGSDTSTTGHIAPLFSNDDRNLDKVIKYWLTKDIKPSKLMVGMSGFGKCFTLKSPKQNKIGAPATDGCRAGNIAHLKYLSFPQICELIRSPKSRSEWSEDQYIPYLIDGEKWIGYENEKSLKAKVKHLLKNKLGGWSFWEPSLDDFEGTKCAGIKYPLLKAMNDALLPSEESKSTGKEILAASQKNPKKHEIIGILNVMLSNICNKKKATKYIFPINCKYYVNCTTPVPSVSRCSRNSYFEERISTCSRVRHLSEQTRTKCKVPSIESMVPEEKPVKPRIPSRLQMIEQLQIMFQNICHKKPDGNYTIMALCEVFVNCKKEVASVLKCSENTYFDERTSKCLGRRSVSEETINKCKIRFKDSEKSATDEEEGDLNLLRTHCVGKHDGIHIHPNDCNNFIVCRKSLPTVIGCPGNTYFDERTLSCSKSSRLSPARRAKCEASKKVSSRISAKKLLGGQNTLTRQEMTDKLYLLMRNICIKNHGRKYIHPINCKYYVNCTIGMPSVTRCSRTTYFDERTDSCVGQNRLSEAQKVKCKEMSPTFKESTSQTRLTNQQAIASLYVMMEDICIEKQNGKYTYYIDCKTYVYCMGGVPHTISCSINNYIDERLSSCVHSNDLTEEMKVKCNVPLETSSNRNSNDEPDSLQAELANELYVMLVKICDRKPDGKYTYLDFCNIYVECNGEYPTMIKCPKNTYYEEISLSCVTQNRLSEDKKVKCEITTENHTENISTTSSNRILSQEENLEVLDKIFVQICKTSAVKMHPVNCKYFVNCTSGTTPILRCSRGSYFDERSTSCIAGGRLSEETRTKCKVPRKQTSYKENNGEKFSESYVEKQDNKKDTINKLLRIICNNNPAVYRVNCKYYVNCKIREPYVTRCSRNSYFEEQSSTCIRAGHLSEEAKTMCNISLEQLEKPNTYENGKVLSLQEITYELRTIMRIYCGVKPDGKYVYTNNCQYWVYCMNGVSYFNKCISNKYFDEKSSSCVSGNRLSWEKRIKCKIWPHSENEPEIPEEYPKHGTTPQKHTLDINIRRQCELKYNGRYAYPGDCNFYIQCRNGKPDVVRCLPDTYYDGPLSSCIRKSHLSARTIFKCRLPSRNDTTPELPSMNKTSAEEDIEIEMYIWLAKLCRENEKHVYPDNCKLYVNCSQGGPSLVQCPRDTYFDDLSLSCIKTDRLSETRSLKCKEQNRQRTDPTMLSEESEEEPSLYGTKTINSFSAMLKRTCLEKTNGKHVYTDNCKYYVKCTKTKPLLVRCSRNTYFEEKSSSCVSGNRLFWEKKIKCKIWPDSEKDPVITEEYPQYRTAPRNIVQKHTFDINIRRQCELKYGGRYAYPGDCNFYIQCRNGKPVVIRCPQDNYYDDLSSSCEEDCNLSEERKVACKINIYITSEIQGVSSSISVENNSSFLPTNLSLHQRKDFHRHW